MSPIEPLSKVRKSHISEVLAHARGDMALACRILGVSAEDLRQLLISHDLEPPQPAAQSNVTPEEE